MDFSLTDDQELLRDTAHKLLERECPPALVRAHIDDPSVYESLWRHLAEYVALGNGPATDACLFLEQTGYVAAPGPFLATLLFRSLAGDDVDRGATTGTIALVGDDTHPFVLEADRVESVAIVLPGPKLAVVGASDLGVTFVPNVDFSRRLFTLAAPPARAEPLDPARLAAWRDRAHALLAAEMVGIARRIFDMSLQYAKEREQFDRPIGSFQAIQHKLADMSLALERATAAVHYAAMTVDAADAERERACHVAQAAAGEAARRILKDGAQIHGGIGYTWEHDLHLYLRRATADEYLLGSTGWHLDRLADLVMGPSQAVRGL
ncbi:MAG TPA: acyl-CoA dehydrogenase [Acidimicrobiia bacterium]|nr:acyl-CoA dehydrogenase [Acidimicrobiia bacterium]